MSCHVMYTNGTTRIVQRALCVFLASWLLMHPGALLHNNLEIVCAGPDPGIALALSCPMSPGADRSRDRRAGAVRHVRVAVSRRRPAG
jgi:hypothetical protein